MSCPSCGWCARCGAPYWMEDPRWGMPWRFPRARYRPSREEERASLREHIEDLRAELREVEERLKDLEAEPGR